MKHALTGHDARTVDDMKWRGILNGKLLALASTEFDVFITVDKNLQFQQNLDLLPPPVLPFIRRRLDGKMLKNISLKSFLP